MSINENNHATSKGAHVELLATQWLIKQGLKLITQNYRCKCGEIDIIMSSQGPQGIETLVFVEVRYRKQKGFGSAIESVDKRKQKKLLLTASHFITITQKHANLPCRFDVLAAQPTKHHDKLHWLWVKDAFSA